VLKQCLESTRTFKLFKQSIIIGKPSFLVYRTFSDFQKDSILEDSLPGLTVDQLEKIAKSDAILRNRHIAIEAVLDGTLFPLTILFPFIYLSNFV